MKTHDMTRTAAEKKADQESWMQPMEVRSPDYPHGLHVTLEAPELKKQGIGQLPPIGAKYRIQGGMKVTEANDPELSGNGQRRLHLVLHDLGMERVDEPEKKEKSLREELEDARHLARGTTATQGRIGARQASEADDEC